MRCERCGAIAEKGQRKYCKACGKIVERELQKKYKANRLRKPKVWVDPSEHFTYEAKICLNCERKTCTNCLGWKTMKQKTAMLEKIESEGRNG